MPAMINPVPLPPGSGGPTSSPGGSTGGGGSAPSPVPIGPSGGGWSAPVPVGALGPVTAPTPGNSGMVQVIVQSYNYYRNAMNYLHGISGAIAASDWSLYFAIGTAFDASIASKIPGMLPTDYSSLPTAAGIRLTNQALSMVLLRVEFLSIAATTGASPGSPQASPTVTTLWINTSPPPANIGSGGPALGSWVGTASGPGVAPGAAPGIAPGGAPGGLPPSLRL